MSLNKTYNGYLMTSGDEDWYKITVSKKGKVKFTLAMGSSVNVDDTENGWSVYLYKKDW